MPISVATDVASGTNVPLSLTALWGRSEDRCGSLSSRRVFSAQVDEARAADGQDWDVASVLTVVQKAARSWNPDRLQRFPDLRWADKISRWIPVCWMYGLHRERPCFAS